MPIGEYRIRPASNGNSLVEFLRATFRVSGRQAKALLDNRDVFVNGQRVWMARHRLQTGDIVRVARLPDGARSRPLKIRILERGPGFLVADKPAGLLADGEFSVESVLRAQCAIPALQAVHRLDRDTSGCLLVATAPDAHAALVAQFREREVMKLYHAIVHGRIGAPERRITQAIDGQPAVSLLRVLDRGRQATHVRVRIESGRTHQIRIHLMAIHHPILGDRQYADKRAIEEHRLAVPRQMLHAAKLHFQDPATGRIVRAESPLPPDFRACLRAQRLR
jgi:23S rRNA pseudouridine1911/1915/1917 synthase